MEHKFLKHIVLFSFTQQTPSEKINEIVNNFLDLRNKIQCVEDIDWGINNSPEGLNQGLTHCFTVTFKNEEARDEYLPHKAHKAFSDSLAPYLDKVLVVDYYPQSQNS
jgi:hypothetical protein